jgi:hypothetical protein
MLKKCGGTGTVITWNHGFLHLKFFHSHFYNKFDETYQFFPCKKAYHVQRQDFFQIFLKNCAFYGLDTIRSLNRKRNGNRNSSKV